MTTLYKNGQNLFQNVQNVVKTLNPIYKNGLNSDPHTKTFRDRTEQLQYIAIYIQKRYHLRYHMQLQSLVVLHFVILELTKPTCTHDSEAVTAFDNYFDLDLTCLNNAQLNTPKDFTSTTITYNIFAYTSRSSLQQKTQWSTSHKQLKYNLSDKFTLQCKD